MKTWKQKKLAAVISIKGILIFTVLFVTAFLFTACITTKKQDGPVEKQTKPSVVYSVAVLPFWGADINFSYWNEKEVYSIVKNMKIYNPVMKNFNPVQVNSADIPIPYEIPASSLFKGNDLALTGELRRVKVEDSGVFVQGGMATQEMKTRGGLTAAHPSLPIGSKARITNIAGEEVVVTITGRIAPSPTRIVDLSLGAALALDIERGGPVILNEIWPSGTDTFLWRLRLYLWRENRLIISDEAAAYDHEKLVTYFPDMLEEIFSWFSWIEREEYPARPAKNTTVSSAGRTQSVALVPFWGSEQNIIDQFGAELYAAVGNIKGYRPVMIDMTNLPDDVPERGFPPYICPSPSQTKTNLYALTGEVTRTDTGSWDLRLYLWAMEDTRLVFTSKLTARNRSECKSLFPGLLEKLFSKI